MHYEKSSILQKCSREIGLTDIVIENLGSVHPFIFWPHSIIYHGQSAIIATPITTVKYLIFYVKATRQVEVFIDFAKSSLSRLVSSYFMTCPVRKKSPYNNTPVRLRWN